MFQPDKKDLVLNSISKLGLLFILATKKLDKRASNNITETERFEPSHRNNPIYTLSRGASSAT